MDISIIIGLLIALVIICATTIVNNLINKDYISLRERWNKRAIMLSEITYNIGKLDEFTAGLAKYDLSDEAKKHLFLLSSRVKDILGNVKDYERESFNYG